MAKTTLRAVAPDEKAAPKTFFTVEELRSVREGIFPVHTTMPRQGPLLGRKSK